MSKKKWLIIGGILLAVAIIATITTIALVRYYSMRGTCGDNLTWVYDGKGTLTISGTGRMYDFDNGDNRPPWRKFTYAEIDTIIIESGVQNIGDYAFECYYNGRTEPETSLQEVYIADSVTEIGHCAFYGCDSLSEIKLPESVSEIESCAFSHCLSLKQINLPQSITTIDCFAFEGCQSLDNVYLPPKIKIIEQNLFSGCGSLSRIDIPESVAEIESGAFANCTSLSEIRFHGASPEISEGWEDLIEGAFHNVTATAYYPSEQWYGFTPKGFGGNIDWYPS